MGVGERSKGYDLTIIGAFQTGMLQQLVFGTFPKQVGQRAKNTVIMVKRPFDITSRATRHLRRLFG